MFFVAPSRHSVRHDFIEHLYRASIKKRAFRFYRQRNQTDYAKSIPSSCPADSYTESTKRVFKRIISIFLYLKELNIKPRSSVPSESHGVICITGCEEWHAQLRICGHSAACVRKTGICSCLRPFHRYGSFSMIFMLSPEAGLLHLLDIDKLSAKNWTVSFPLRN